MGSEKERERQKVKHSIIPNNGSRGFLACCRVYTVAGENGRMQSPKPTSISRVGVHVVHCKGPTSGSIVSGKRDQPHDVCLIFPRRMKNGDSYPNVKD